MVTGRVAVCPRTVYMPNVNCLLFLEWMQLSYLQEKGVMLDLQRGRIQYHLITIPLNCLYDILLLVLLIIKTDIVNVVRIIASYKRSEHFKGYFLTNEFFWCLSGHMLATGKFGCLVYFPSENFVCKVVPFPISCHVYLNCAFNTCISINQLFV